MQPHMWPGIPTIWQHWLVKTAHLAVVMNFGSVNISLGLNDMNNPVYNTWMSWVSTVISFSTNQTLTISMNSWWTWHTMLSPMWLLWPLESDQSDHHRLGLWMVKAWHHKKTFNVNQILEVEDTVQWRLGLIDKYGWIFIHHLQICTVFVNIYDENYAMLIYIPVVFILHTHTWRLDV